jgi:hypothetical protein
LDGKTTAKGDLTTLRDLIAAASGKTEDVAFRSYSRSPANLTNCFGPVQANTELAKVQQKIKSGSGLLGVAEFF